MLLSELLAALAPPGCLACRVAVAGSGERLCADCTRALPWLRRGCPRCGLPTHRRRGCPAAFAAFPRSWAPLAYEGVARDLVGALKFHAALPAADVMAAHMAANLPASLRAADAALVPVRRRRRTGGRAGSTRRACSRGSSRGGSTARSRTASCAAAGPRGRSAPRAHARRAAGRIDIRVRGSPPPRAIIVDDVHTTGATLDACARALASEGTTVVAAISYARTLSRRRRGRPRPPTRARRGRRRRATESCRSWGASGTRRARRP